MKGVRAVLDQAVDGASTPGLWLSLPTLLELPLTPALRLELLRWLLAELAPDDATAASWAGKTRDQCRAVLLAALEQAELSQARLHLEAGAWQQGRSAWEAALAHQRHLQQLDPAALGISRLLEGLIQLLACLDQALTHRHGQPPTTPLDNAEAHAHAGALLQQIRALDRTLPPWFAVVEEGLLRRGAQALLQQPGARWRREGIVLLLRLGRLHPPLPGWLVASLELAVLSVLDDLAQSSQPAADLQALVAALHGLDGVLLDAERRAVVHGQWALAQGCLALASEARQPHGLGLGVGQSWDAAIDPAAIAELVQDWLALQPPLAAPITLELVWIPGARPVPHGPGQLALNLAALPPDSVDAPQRLAQQLAALSAPLRQSRPRHDWLLRPASTSLLASVGQCWASGGALSWANCRLLAKAQELWPGPADGAVPPASLAPGCCLLRPGTIQLAALRCWMLQREQLLPALLEIRRHHHDAAFMQQQSARAADGAAAALETLCALHLQEGFYASVSAPMASLEAWVQACVQALAHGQVLVDPQRISASWWAVLQGVVQEHNHRPALVVWPEEERIYQLLAGQEVVLVSPHADLALEQHRSGRAFSLFRDLEILPYGLRTLAAPRSCYPERPQQGFEASLAACLDALEGLARQQPFSVLLSVAGAYDLPLCQAARARFGASYVAIGPSLHARLGIEEPCSEGWRSEQRRADRWRRIC